MADLRYYLGGDISYDEYVLNAKTLTEEMNISDGSAPVIKHLVKRGYNVNVRQHGIDYCGPPLAQLLNNNRNEGVLDIFLRAGANPNINFNPHPNVMNRLLDNFEKRGDLELFLLAGGNINYLKSMCMLLNRKEIRIQDIIKKWPRVVPLRLICLRVIKYTPRFSNEYTFSKRLCIPEWFPRLLLEFENAENYLE